MRSHLVTSLLCLTGLCAGYGADRLGWPLPYMIGPLVCAGVISTALPGRLPRTYEFPPRLRLVFIAVIGLMIGTQVTPDLFSGADRFLVTGLALVGFVVLCHGYNYCIFRRLGRYDPVTAFYCSSPGGLYESLSMGEEAGGDVARLTLQQFLRIILVVTLLPVGLSIWTGAPVGSASGLSFAKESVPWSDLPLIALAGLAGGVMGHLMRLPAKQLAGPLLMAAILSGSGVLSIDMPDWLIKLAQVVVGVALGMRFKGLAPRLILHGAGLAFVSVGGMLLFSAFFAAILMPLTGEGFDVLLISFAPGGVTEMALVALSLQVNPAFVTLHHVARILFTVVGLVISSRLWWRRGR